MEKVLVTSTFSPFPKMFSTLPKTNFNFSVTFILSSANALKLDQSKILLFGKGLKAFADDNVNMMISVYNRAENTVGKKKILFTSIFSFSHCVFQSLLLRVVKSRDCVEKELTLSQTGPAFTMSAVHVF